jgi:hypothetical protein
MHILEFYDVYCFKFLYFLLIFWKSNFTCIAHFYNFNFYEWYELNLFIFRIFIRYIIYNYEKTT